MWRSMYCTFKVHMAFFFTVICISSKIYLQHYDSKSDNISFGYHRAPSLQYFFEWIYSILIVIFPGDISRYTRQLQLIRDYQWHYLWTYHIFSPSHSIHKFISITRPFKRTVTPGKIVMMLLAAWGWTVLFNLTPTPVLKPLKLQLTETGEAMVEYSRMSEWSIKCNLPSVFSHVAYDYTLNGRMNKKHNITWV